MVEVFGTHVQKKGRKQNASLHLSEAAAPCDFKLPHIFSLKKNI
jgi:hypothetical protein